MRTTRTKYWDTITNPKEEGGLGIKDLRLDKMTICVEQ